MNIRAMKPGTVNTSVRDAHQCLRKNRMTTAHALNVAEALNRAGFKKIVWPAVSNSGVRNNHLRCEYDPLRSEGRSYPTAYRARGGMSLVHIWATSARGRSNNGQVSRPSSRRSVSPHDDATGSPHSARPI